MRFDMAPPGPVLRAASRLRASRRTRKDQSPPVVRKQPAQNDGYLLLKIQSNDVMATPIFAAPTSPSHHCFEFSTASIHHFVRAASSRLGDFGPFWFASTLGGGTPRAAPARAEPCRSA